MQSMKQYEGHSRTRATHAALARVSTTRRRDEIVIKIVISRFRGFSDHGPSKREAQAVQGYKRKEIPAVREHVV